MEGVEDGAVVEWLGWANMAWSWVGLGFFVYTFVNLVLGRRPTGGGIWRSLGMIILRKGRLLFLTCI